MSWSFRKAPSGLNDCSESSLTTWKKTEYVCLDLKTHSLLFGNEEVGHERCNSVVSLFPVIQVGEDDCIFGLGGNYQSIR